MAVVCLISATATHVAAAEGAAVDVADMGGLARLRREGMIGDHLQLVADDALDVAQQAAFLAVAEAVGDAGRSGTRGAADAVDVAFRLHRAGRN